MNRQLCGAQASIQVRGAPAPERVKVAVKRSDGLALQGLQEFIHCAHHVGMRVEGAARKAHVDGAFLVIASHQVASTAHHSHGQSTAEGLAVGHEVGLTPKYSCAPPGARRKPTNTSSKIRTISAFEHTYAVSQPAA